MERVEVTFGDSLKNSSKSESKRGRGVKCVMVPLATHKSRRNKEEDLRERGRL